MEQEKKKSNMILIILIIILVVLVIGMGLYIAHDKGLLFFSKEEVAEKDKNNTTKTSDKEDSVDVPKDMNAVSTKLTEDLGMFINYRLDDLYGINLLSNSAKRINLVNSLFMQDGTLSWTNAQANGKSYQDFPYVKLDTYKAKYKEVFGDLNQFESDKAASSLLFMANTIDQTMSSDLIAWNGTWGVTSNKLNIKAAKVDYDKTTKQFTISGTLDYVDNDNVITKTKNISIVYANNGTQNYIVSIVVT